MRPQGQVLKLELKSFYSEKLLAFKKLFYRARINIEFVTHFQFHELMSIFQTLSSIKGHKHFQGFFSLKSIN